MTIKIFIDGAARPNPGKGGIGVCIKSENWSYNISDTCANRVTNNQSEYIALYRALSELINNDLTNEEVIIYSDSEMLVEQMCGRREVLKGSYINEYKRVKQLLGEHKFKSLWFTWIPREQNDEANMLASLGVSKNGL